MGFNYFTISYNYLKLLRLCKNSTLCKNFTRILLMDNLDYNKIQSEIIRPQSLCLHCGRCMPIIDGQNLNSDNIDVNAVRGPISVWDEYPEECGFTGWLFWEREKQKHLVRQIKEEIIALSSLSEDTIVGKDLTAKTKIEQLRSQIEPWMKHGADNW